MLNLVLFNPRAACHKPRIPNSILQVASSINNIHNYFIIDGNLETNPLDKLLDCFSKNKIQVFGLTVMPGPQLKQAIPYSKIIKEKYPNIVIIWGGYFPSNQPKTVLNSGYVDFIINGMGDKVFPELLNCIEHDKPILKLSNIIYKKENDIIISKKDNIYDLEKLPILPYEKLNTFYNIDNYLGKTYLGTKTIAYHSSFGCPFTCSFCAVVPIYNARWKGFSAQRIYSDIMTIKKKYGGNAIEFHDNNFFVSEKRTVEFAKLISKEKMNWWGEARIDTMDKYSDESLRQISESGCKMIFFGAETGNDEVLKKIDKGGSQTGEQIISFAKRIAKFDIIPEYSFVLGIPGDNEYEINKQIDEDINFIRKVKEANSKTEIIIYTYSPVPTEGSDLFNKVQSSGFKFPEKLEDWISPEWEKFDLRKNPLTPWLKPYMIDKIRNFETVLNGYYPSISDIRFSYRKKRIIKTISTIRYTAKIYKFPNEIKLLQKIWKYRQPEIEGF